LLIGGCPADSPSVQPATTGAQPAAEAAKPWPRLKAIIIADLTAPENRPVDLEAEEDKAVRGALTAPGRFHSALSKDPGACAIEVKTFYGLLHNGELAANADQGKAKLVMEAEAHCPTQGRSDGEVETYRTTLFRQTPFSNVDGDPSTDGVSALRGLLTPLSEQVAATLYGQVTVRHAPDDVVLTALKTEQPAGVLMEAAAEAGERKLLDAVDSLVALTRHTDDVVVLRAGAALGLLGVASDSVITALAEMTEGPDHERHLIAVHALGDIGGHRAARYLETLAVGHPRPALREAARQAAKRAKMDGTKADTGDRSRHDAPPGTGAERP